MLATGDPELARQARATYQKLGIDAERHLRGAGERAAIRSAAPAFHVLGNADTRENWSASNSSYIERDADDRLRGFDDHDVDAVAVRRRARPAGATVRRDYRELVPLLRHRHQPDHSAVKASPGPRSRRAHHHRCPAAAAGRADPAGAAATRSETGRAAAVVLDAATGEVLALGSYPFPVVDRPVRPASEDRDERCSTARATASIRRDRRSSW